MFLTSARVGFMSFLVVSFLSFSSTEGERDGMDMWARRWGGHGMGAEVMAAA